MTESYPAFPAGDGALTLGGLLEEFAQCARLDDVSAEVPEATRDVIDKELSSSNRTDSQRAQLVAMMFARPFKDINDALAKRGVGSAWTCFYTADRGGVVRARWYRMSPAQAREFEATGAISTATMMRRTLVRMAAALGFYVLLWQAWARQTAVWYVAASAALVGYFVLRWRLPVKPAAS